MSKEFPFTASIILKHPPKDTRYFIAGFNAKTSERLVPRMPNDLKYRFVKDKVNKIIFIGWKHEKTN